ncbi:NADPH-dependent F420 reductase [Peristeroidobacter agariperforans]|uniref:NADPH-dependent F420 reductase n=1 Tax=Peristeroidobacter agariperforans TaxID=268404 RepID=UPI00101D5015|nr:NADPH-dependent F420 reductase [Peristeroidobacter agariperforans]
MNLAGFDANRRRLLKLAAAAALVGSGALSAAVVTNKRIGVIGSGKVGSALGGSWIKSGHEVMFSSRNLDHDQQLASRLGAKARAGSPAEALAFGHAVLFAVPYGALPELGKSLGSALQGRIVIDACNPFPARDGEIANRAREQGAGLTSAELLPGARLVRAFNAIGAARMATAIESPGKVGMPMAGDEEQAIALAKQLIRDVGYEPVLIGGLDMGKYLMPGTPLAGEHTPAEIREIVAKLSAP